MFDGPDDARRVLETHFDASRVEAIVNALVPAVVFEPIPEGRPVIGGTKFGGVPDLPAGTEWPRPLAPDDPENIAQRGNDDAAEHMRRHLALGLPYTFIAQVDLAEASALGAATSMLPRNGRLLFFYDVAVGPWDTGTRPARVIWDTSPSESIVPLPRPNDLAEADERYRKETDEIRSEYGRRRREEGTNYGAPARTMRLKPTLRLPHPASVEISALPELEAAYHRHVGWEQTEDIRARYEAALVDGCDELFPAQAWHRQQLLGSPIPEQDDPRYGAAVFSTFRRQFLSPEEWQEHTTEIDMEAREWLLLLQVDLGDWMRAEFVEGTVYFVIRKSDILARHFEKVVAVYQQT